MTNKDFFLDIFNNILDYNNNKVMIIFDGDGNIWFGLRDVMKMLGYADILNIVNNMKINDDYRKKFIDLKGVLFTTPPCNFQKNTNFVNEFGLYEILTKSKKTIAKLFLNKYLTEIMPQIRKTGKYVSNEKDLKKIKALNNKLDNYKTELNYYDNKYTFEPSKFGYLYINEDNQIRNGIKHKCFKVGFTLDMKKRVKEYKVGNFKHKLLAYIPLKIDRKQIEKCVKTRLKPHLTKIITDTVCYVSLTELKKEIIDCINFTNKHICHCVKCSKIYNLSILDKHKCNIVKTRDIIKYSITSKNNSKVSKKSKNKIY